MRNTISCVCNLDLKLFDELYFSSNSDSLVSKLIHLAVFASYRDYFDRICSKETT